ncbi:hypothetical protein [Winogradskyella jejuensis]|uniref:Dihydrolipoamide dehydrogenase n=1 Tax=Winogradskyella jejuensis TaxID=1089305 RepID=A0A1M5TA00_9FLAO|nr:hypothetical protein [Winogradskyella jejuensis]SHH47506.1 hypothetical protein SAMN05444148_2099 [Winogradskyella jejuensis]
MKRILTLITAFTLVFTACEGPQGPPGFDGLNGVNFVGQSFERTVDLVAPDYRAEIEIPLDIELFETDMVLVYHLLGVDNDGFDIWRLLPDTVYTDNGLEFQYNFEHNFDFVDIFIEGPSTLDLSTLLPGDTLDQTFRIVILPVDFVNSVDLNLNDLNSVMNYVEVN